MTPLYPTNWNFRPRPAGTEAWAASRRSVRTTPSATWRCAWPAMACGILLKRRCGCFPGGFFGVSIRFVDDFKIKHLLWVFRFEKETEGFFLKMLMTFGLWVVKLEAVVLFFPFWDKWEEVETAHTHLSIFCGMIAWYGYDDMIQIDVFF